MAMSVRIRYMGNKHALAGDVSSIVADLAPDKPFLDLFCGMCSVGAEVAKSGRPVWGNDVQHVASTVARCLLVERDEPPPRALVAAALTDAFQRNRTQLRERFARSVEAEASVLTTPSVDGMASLESGWHHAGNNSVVAAEVESLAAKPASTPYRLCTLTFANGYFGLAQSIDVDSIQYSIDLARGRGALSPGEARWTRLALLQAVSVVASTPGHFAQYLHSANETSLSRVARQRRRDVWTTFLTELETLAPIGDADWRASNRTFRRDALAIWSELSKRGFKGGVIYADPPYSADHYSRYYHVLESLLRYDYPTASGIGRYRPNRFATPFSIKTKVRAAFAQLFAGAARLDCTLVLSYPENGLLIQRGGDLNGLLTEHFTSVDRVLQRSASHSTLGGRHGSASNSVDELIFVAS